MIVKYLKCGQECKGSVIKDAGYYVIDDEGIVEEPFCSKEDAEKWIQENQFPDITR